MTPSEQSRADAMADAETLRLFQASQPLPLDDFDWLPYPEMGALRCAVDLNLWARGHFYETERAIVDDAVWIVAAIAAGLLFVTVVFRIVRRVRRVRAGEPVRPPLEDDEEERE